MQTTVTKTVEIGRSVEDAYQFLADPATMPQWAIHNVKAIKRLDDRCWEMETPRGKARLVPHYEKARGILDHEFLDAGEGRWQVTARVVPAGPEASVYIITLTQPEAMPDDAFAAGMRLMDDEMNALKRCVEALPSRSPEPLHTVEAVYDGFRQRDMSRIFSLLSPEIEIRQSEELPWGGHYQGHDGARAFFGKLGAHLNSTLTLERMISAGDSVVAVGWTEGTVNATGARYRVPVAHVWEVRNGLVVQVQFYINHPSMFEALR